MKEYKRKNPSFSLCGLNCCLCPRYHTESPSKCPGCGGKDFHLKHPSCAVITCSKQHGGMEYCFECPDYPCKKYKQQNGKDSFITYRNVLTDFDKASNGLKQYTQQLHEKEAFLKYILNCYNDGKRKSFYCLAVNLLTLQEAGHAIEVCELDAAFKSADVKAQAQKIAEFFQEKAKARSIELILRK